jgi:hypothetical protein
MKRLLTLTAVLLAAGMTAHAQAPGANTVTAGEFLVEPATLINLGFEWFIDGDANRTASVEVSYRKAGTTGWHTALPLLPLSGERIRQGTQLDVTVPNMFAGSILDLETRQFKTLEEYSEATRQDTHSVLVDYDIFVKVPPLNAQDKATVQKVYKREDLDFRLKPGSAAVDRGAPVPTITDGHTGSAPDLGALEHNVPPPHYGPRE